MNEYEQKYHELIQFRKYVQPLEHKAGETERHHIKPVSLWPKFANDPNNIVELTILEHIQAHKYLAKWYEAKYGLQDNRCIAALNAYHFMHISRNGIVDTDEIAAELRAKYSSTCSLLRKGKPLSEKNRTAILQTLRSAEFRKAQSERIHAAYRNTDFGQKITAANIRRYSNQDEREKTRQKSLEYFRNHPEAKKKHSEDLKGRIHIYNIALKQCKFVKTDIANKLIATGIWTLGTPLYGVKKRGKNAGQIEIKYMCPWKINNCCYLKVSCNGKKPYWSLQKPNSSS